MSARGALAAHPAPRPDTRPRERTRPRVVSAPRRRRRFRLRIRLGLAVIPLVAMLFAGVVWLNSAKLAVTKRQGQVARQSVLVREQVAGLKSRLAQSDSVVIKKAELQGMSRPESGEWTYVRARQGR